MPLTRKGRKALEGFKEQYDKGKGIKLFYAYMKKHPGKTREWHK